MGATPAIYPEALWRLTLEEFRLFAANGAFREGNRAELIEGLLFRKMTHNPPHDGTLDLVLYALLDARPPGYFIRVQSAITANNSEPEPDFALVRGRPGDYLDRHPLPSEVALVVEIADSSLRIDRVRKSRMYARARIPAYWIVNVVGGILEVRTDPVAGRNPQYRSVVNLGLAATATFTVDDFTASIPVDRLLRRQVREDET